MTKAKKITYAIVIAFLLFIAGIYFTSSPSQPIYKYSFNYNCKTNCKKGAVIYKNGLTITRSGFPLRYTNPEKAIKTIRDSGVLTKKCPEASSDIADLNESFIFRVDNKSITIRNMNECMNDAKEIKRIINL